MKIRFNMEIRGCRYVDSRVTGNATCPAYHFDGSFYNPHFCCHSSFKSGSKKLPKRLNPSWCPMMRGVK